MHKEQYSYANYEELKNNLNEIWANEQDNYEKMMELIENGNFSP